MLDNHRVPRNANSRTTNIHRTYRPSYLPTYGYEEHFGNHIAKKNSDQVNICSSWIHRALDRKQHRSKGEGNRHT